MAEFTFYPEFSEFVAYYNGLTDVWIGDGTTPAGQKYIDDHGVVRYKGGTAGYLYGIYHNGAIDEIGFVSDYEEAKVYLGPDFTYERWVHLLADTPHNAEQSMLWAYGNDQGDYVSGKSAREQANRAAVWAVGSTTDTDNGAVDNNAKYWAELSKGYANGKDLDDQPVQARATDNAEYFKNQAKLWANGGTDGETPSAVNNAKAYAQNSANSATASANSASDSATSAAAALASQNAAATSESNAATSETNAHNSELAAATSETNAATSETNSATSETNAATSASNSATSASESEASNVSAQQWATGGTGATYTQGNSAKEQADRAAVWAVGDSTGDGSETNNSKYWSQRSANSASAAATEAQNAATSEANALSYANTATTKAGEALASASSASTSATMASTKASEANTSAINAATSETNAAASADEAAMWATGQTTGTPSATYNSKYFADYMDDRIDDLGRFLSSATTVYQSSSSSSTIPAGIWTNDPTPQRGMYLWSRTTFTWSDGSPDTVYYGVSYNGVDSGQVVAITNAEIDTLFA